MVKARSTNPKNYFSNNYRGCYFRGSSARGRNSYYSRRGYVHNNVKYFHNNRWERVPLGQGSRPKSRPLSPVEGSEEFMARKIEQTSAIIMRQLLSPNDNETVTSLPKLANNDKIGKTVKKCVKRKENKEKQNDKGPSSTRKIGRNEINVKEIHDKIMCRLTNLSEGKKKNFINTYTHNTSLDSALQHIHKEKRLELSRVLRDMCSSTQTLETSGKLINSIIPDIGIKLEELPIDVIEELRKTLNLDLDEDILDFTGPGILESSSPAMFNFPNPALSDLASPALLDSPSPAVLDSANTAVFDSPSPAVFDYSNTANFDSVDSAANSPMVVSSNELNAAIDSIQVKTEKDDNLACSGSVEIKLEDIVDCNSIDHTQSNFEESDSGRTAEMQISETEHAQQIINQTDDFFSVKEEPLEYEQSPSVASTFSDTTLFICRDNSYSQETHIDKTYKDVLEERQKVIVHLPIDSRNNSNNDKTSNTEHHDTASSQTEHSLSSLENFLTICLENEDALNVSDLNVISKNIELVDKCLKYLSTYKKMMIQSLLDRCFEMKGSSKNRKDDGVSQADTLRNNYRNQSNQNIENIATLEDEDKITTKRRKVEIKKKKTGEEMDKQKTAEIQIKKEEQSNNEELLEQDLLQFPELKDRVMVIEKVENRLILATESGNVIYVSLKDGSFLHTIDVTNSPITSLIFLKGINEFTFMYVGCLDKALRIYDFKSRNIKKVTPLDDHIRCMDAMWDYVFMGCRGGTLIRYSAKKGKIEFEEKNAGDDILVLKAAQEGPRRVLIVGHKQAPIYVRDAMSGLYLRNFNNEAISPTVYSLIVNNNKLYCGTARSNILVFSFHEGTLLNRLFAEEGKGISCMNIWKDLLFSGCYNGSIYIYNLKDKKLLSTLKGPGGSISCIKVLCNQVIVGTLTGKITSIPIPHEVFLNSL